MKKAFQKPLADILNKGSFSLGNLRHKVTELTAFNQRLQAILPEELRPHCQVANYRDQKLIVMCDSAAWSTRIRFMEQDLLKKLRTDKHFHINGIRCMIKQSQVEEDEQFWDTVPMSNESRTNIKQLADSLEDGPLKNSLLKLAK